MRDDSYLHEGQGDGGPVGDHDAGSRRDLIQVVLDDASVERLRIAAARRNIEVEQLMVQLLHVASGDVDAILAAAEATAPDVPATRIASRKVKPRHGYLWQS